MRDTNDVEPGSTISISRNEGGRFPLLVVVDQITFHLLCVRTKLKESVSVCARTTLLVTRGEIPFYAAKQLVARLRCGKKLCPPS